MNVFSHGMDTATYLATSDPFPGDKNYVVLGLGSAAADFAVRLHKEGWPAVIAVGPHHLQRPHVERGGPSGRVDRRKLVACDLWGEHGRDAGSPADVPARTAAIVADDAAAGRYGAPGVF